MTILKSYDAELGTPGTGVTVENSGSSSGDAFAAIVTGGQGTVIFDNTHARGSLSYRFACQGTTSGPAAVRVAYPETGLTFARFYLYITGIPATHRILHVYAGDGTTGVSLQLRTSGKINICPASGSLFGANDMATSVPLNQWVRVEAKFTMSTTAGQGEVKLFLDPDSTTPTETKTTTADQVYTTSAGRTVFGSSGNILSIEFWEDNLAVSSDTYPGPNVVPGSAVSVQTNFVEVNATDSIGTTSLTYISGDAVTITTISPGIYRVELPSARAADVVLTLTASNSGGSSTKTITIPTGSVGFVGPSVLVNGQWV